MLTAVSPRSPRVRLRSKHNPMFSVLNCIYVVRSTERHIVALLRLIRQVLFHDRAQWAVRPMKHPLTSASVR
jgi:hypothetical protein